MKSINLILIYLGTFMCLFFLFSCIGLLWIDSYHTIISNNGWFMCYSMFFGWWTSIFPAREYYMAHEQYFHDVF
jgi:hypothetical protein